MIAFETGKESKEKTPLALYEPFWAKTNKMAKNLIGQLKQWRPERPLKWS